MLIKALTRDRARDQGCALTCRSTAIAPRPSSKLFLDWVLTAHTHDYPAGWKAIFAERATRGTITGRLSTERHGGPMTAVAAKENAKEHMRSTSRRARAVQAA